MATYVISDIHGMYDKFLELLEIINLGKRDILYILGDVVDRGPHPIKVLQRMMLMPNVIPMLGNHELMAVRALRFLNQKITLPAIDQIDTAVLENLLNWQNNGYETTLREFLTLDMEQREDVLAYMEGFSLYEEVFTAGISYLLVHAGLGNFSPDKALDEYTLDELVWERPNYDVAYFQNKFVVSGHTPTQVIEENPRRGYIYRNQNHIAIDCGACFRGGRLAAICLETGEEFYSSVNEE